MKTKITLTLIILISTICCAGKPFMHDGKLVPSRTKKILIVSDENQSIFFQKMKSAAVKDGYTIASQDKDTFSFQTEPKVINSNSFNSYDIEAQLRIHVLPEKTIVTGYTLVPTIGGTDKKTDIELFGQEGSHIRNAWNEMYRYAKQFGKKITFE